MARIVVLDDEQVVCQAIEARLTMDGHEVRTSNSGDVAIDLGYLFQPDLLITDWNLKSDYDGLEVAEAFTAAKKNIKTILISGYNVEDHEAESVVETLSKPFSIKELSNAVDRALAN